MHYSRRGVIKSFIFNFGINIKIFGIVIIIRNFVTPVFLPFQGVWSLLA